MPGLSKEGSETERRQTIFAGYPARAQVYETEGSRSGQRQRSCRGINFAERRGRVRLIMRRSGSNSHLGGFAWHSEGGGYCVSLGACQHGMAFGISGSIVPRHSHHHF